MQASSLNCLDGLINAMALKDRIKEAMDAAKLGPAEMARLAGVSKATVTFWLNGQTQSLKAHSASALEAATGYRASWLISGKGAKLVTETPNVGAAEIGITRIPLISCVQAGLWTEIVDNFDTGDAQDWLMTDTRLSRRSFALEIKGDSMLKEFKPGDRIIVDPDVAPQPGDFVVAKNSREEATFKKYRPRGTDEHGQIVFELVPLNDDYETLRSDQHSIRIIGTMVEHRKYRKRG